MLSDYGDAVVFLVVVKMRHGVVPIGGALQYDLAEKMRDRHIEIMTRDDISLDIHKKLALASMYNIIALPLSVDVIEDSYPDDYGDDFDVPDATIPYSESTADGLSNLSDDVWQQALDEFWNNDNEGDDDEQ